MAGNESIIRDWRRYGWFKVDKAALDAIRRHWSEPRPRTRLSTAIGLYTVLCELANDARDEEVRANRKTLGAMAGLNPSAVSVYFAELSDSGVVEVEERVVEGVQLPNIVTLLPVASGEGGLAQAPDPVASGEAPPSQEATQRPEEDVGSDPSNASEGPKKEEEARAPDSAHEMPPDFPPELRDKLEDVIAILSSIAAARGAPPPSTPSVARAMMRRREKASIFVPVADRFEHWAVHGNGARRQVKDVVARWRDWVDDEIVVPSAGAPAGPQSTSDVLTVLEGGGAG